MEEAVPEYSPASHGMQDSDDSPEYFPFPQFAHANDSDPVVAFVNFLPAEQEMQEAADSPEYFPISQSPHADDSAPVAEFISFFPAGQLAQLV